MKQAGKISCIVLITCLLFSLSSLAQIKATYHFGFIGATGDTSAKLSEPVIIQYDKCFDVTNGLRRFDSQKNGAFAIACLEIPPASMLQVQAFPNPVLHDLTIRSVLKIPERGVVKYIIRIKDFTGKAVKEINTDLKKVNEGVKVNMADIPTGYYVVSLYADTEIIQSFKILKAS